MIYTFLPNTPFYRVTTVWPNVGGRALGEGSALSVSVREPLQRRPPAGIVRLRRPGSGRGGVRLLRGARLARTSWQSPHSSGSGPAAERLSPLAVHAPGTGVCDRGRERTRDSCFAAAVRHAQPRPELPGDPASREPR